MARRYHMAILKLASTEMTMARIRKPDPIVTTVRLPSDVHAFLAARAAKYYSSNSAEIVRMLREEMDRESALPAAAAQRGQEV